MNIWLLVGVIFSLLMIADLTAFYLGRRGLLERIRKTKLGRRAYDKFQNRFGKIIHKNSSLILFLGKITFGASLITICYLGHRMNFKRFILIDMILNLIFVAGIYSLAVMLSLSLSNALSKIAFIQKEILGVVLALIIYVILDEMWLKKHKKY